MGVLPTVSPTFAGVSAAGLAGALSASIAINATASLIGVSASGQAGDITISFAPLLLTDRIAYADYELRLLEVDADGGRVAFVNGDGGTIVFVDAELRAISQSAEDRSILASEEDRLATVTNE